MKTLRLSFAAFVLLCAMACSKGDVRFNNNASVNATDQAANLVTASLSQTTDGAFNTISDVSVETQARVSIDSLCGTVWTDSVTRKTSPANPGRTSYNYTAKYTYALNCDSATKKGIYNGSATATSQYKGSYTGSNLSSTNSGSSTLTLQGLGHGATSYTLNGEYKQSGSYTSKADTGTNNVDITLTNIQLSKPFQLVKSGTATLSVNGMSSKNGSFSYSGILVFNNNNTATLTLNGTVYNINLVTGVSARR